MALLISPSNNTGWGLGTKTMYGGAQRRSDNHPVRVRKHYRAPWGSSKRARANLAAAARRQYKHSIARRVKRRRRRARLIPSSSVSFLRRAIGKRKTKSRPSTSTSAAASSSSAPRNVYWVRNEQGVRVPVTTRPKVRSASK